MDEPELPLLDRLTWAHLAALYVAWLVLVFSVPGDTLTMVLLMSYGVLACLLWERSQHEDTGSRLVTAIGFGAFYFAVLASPLLMFGDLRNYGGSGLGDEACYSERGSHPC